MGKKNAQLFIWSMIGLRRSAGTRVLCSFGGCFNRRVSILFTTILVMGETVPDLNF